jgi:hypothetical protein
MNNVIKQVLIAAFVLIACSLGYQFSTSHDNNGPELIESINSEKIFKQIKHANQTTHLTTPRIGAESFEPVDLKQFEANNGQSLLPQAREIDQALAEKIARKGGSPDALLRKKSTEQLDL